MRKLILIALAGYLWKKFSTERAAGDTAAYPPVPASAEPRPWR